jgi:hypothetical protein
MASKIEDQEQPGLGEALLKHLHSKDETYPATIKDFEDAQPHLSEEHKSKSIITGTAGDLEVSCKRSLRETDFIPVPFMPTEDHTKPIPWKELTPEDQKEVLTWSHKHVQGINNDIENIKKLIPVYPTGKICDGFHTFDELYDMRLALTIALFKQLYDKYTKKYQVNPIWKSKLHEDGTMFENFFVVGAFPPSQHFGEHETITFHYPIEHWNSFWFAAILDKAPPFDGHTAKDVMERLKNL